MSDENYESLDLEALTHPCDIVGMPFVEGADPDCYYCEGHGYDPDKWNEQITEPCPVCMASPDVVPAPPSFTDWDEDGLLDGVTYLQAKYFSGVLKPEKMTTIVMHQGVSSGSISKYFHYAPDGRQVSAHFEVKSNGDIVQCVPLTRRAYHAPPYNWQSFGIEMQGPWNKVWPAIQIDSAVALCESLIAVRPKIHTIRSHSSISKNRRDPGSPKHPFPWDKFKSKIANVNYITKQKY